MRRLVIPSVLLCSAPLLSGCVVATSSRGGSSSSGLFLLFLPLLMFLLMARMMRGVRRSRPVLGARPRERSRSRSEVDEPDIGMIRAELSVLADDVVRLEPQVAIDERARSDYEAAAHRYRVAQAALEQHSDRVDLVRLQRVVDEATWSMARARAALEGRPAPAPPPALRRPGPHGEPAIGLDDGEHPTYVGSSASFQSGWFAGGGILGGLLLGPMFGGWMVRSGRPDDRHRDDRRGW